MVSGTLRRLAFRVGGVCEMCVIFRLFHSTYGEMVYFRINVVTSLTWTRYLANE